MKKQTAFVILTVLLLAPSAYAMSEMANPSMDLSDFQKQYNFTKPAVAW